MRKTKSLLSLLLVFALLFFSLPAPVFADDTPYTGDGFIYDATNRTVTMLANNGMKNFSDYLFWVKNDHDTRLKKIIIGQDVTNLTIENFTNVVDPINRGEVRCELDFSQATGLVSIGDLVCRGIAKTSVDLKACKNLKRIGTGAFDSNILVDIGNLRQFESIGADINIKADAIWLASVSIDGNLLTTFDRNNTAIDAGTTNKTSLAVSGMVFDCFKPASLLTGNHITGVGHPLTFNLKQGKNNLSFTLKKNGYPGTTYTLSVTCNAKPATISNVSYSQSYTVAAPPPAPKVSDFTCDDSDATLNFNWYKGYKTDKTADLGKALSDRPSQPGTYTLVVTSEQTSDYFPGETRLKIEVEPAAPATGAVTYNYEAETIVFDNTIELNTKKDFTGVKIASGDSISAYLGQMLYARKKGTQSTPAGEAAAVKVPERPAAPAELKAVKASAGGQANNGKITGLNPQKTYQYSTNMQAWTAVSSGSSEITNLAEGTYYVRFAATNNAFASKAEELKIGRAKPAAPAGGDIPYVHFVYPDKPNTVQTEQPMRDKVPDTGAATVPSLVVGLILLLGAGGLAGRRSRKH